MSKEKKANGFFPFSKFQYFLSLTELNFLQYKIVYQLTVIY